MNGELLRLIDAIHRDKDIDKEVLFDGIEQALLTAAKRKYGTVDNMRVRIDRDSGEIRAFDGEAKILPIDFGRIAAQTAKQVIIQRIREAEADVVFDEFERYRHQLLNGQVQRIEGGTIVANLGKTDGYLPRHEQVRGETYRVGDRIRAYVVEVKKTPQKVKIILSRSHPELIARLFELEVPEVSEGVITIKKLVREAGYKTKVAVESSDPKVDAIGACVGVRGTRIRNIIDEIGGEKIDIIRWNDSLEVLLMNSLKPAQVDSITLFPDERRALVIVDEDQLSLAIGRKGQNVRLASKLVGWDIDIMTETEAAQQGMSFDGAEAPHVEYVEDQHGDVTSLGATFKGGPLRSPRRRSGEEGEEGEDIEDVEGDESTEEPAGGSAGDVPPSAEPPDGGETGDSPARFPTTPATGDAGDGDAGDGDAGDGDAGDGDAGDGVSGDGVSGAGPAPDMTEGVIEGPSEPESGRDAPAGDPADIDGGMTPSHGESAPAVDASAEEEGKST